MSTLFVSDLDGTLLGADSLISQRSARIISELSRRGAMITVATARTPATVDPLLSHTYTTVPAIVMTGAARWNRQTHKYENLIFMPVEAENIVEQICRQFAITPFIYTLPDDDSFLEVYHAAPQLSHAEDLFYQDRRSLPLKHFNLATPVPPCLSGRKILYFAFGDREAIFAAGRYLEQMTDCSISYYPDIFSDRYGLLEVFAPGVSKAAAIARLKADCGADRVVVFGDNLNDLSMMASADLSIAVANALPEVKEAADLIIGPNTDDSVAVWLDHNSGYAGVRS